MRAWADRDGDAGAGAGQRYGWRRANRARSTSWPGSSATTPRCWSAWPGASCPASRRPGRPAGFRETRVPVLLDPMNVARLIVMRFDASQQRELIDLVAHPERITAPPHGRHRRPGGPSTPPGRPRRSTPGGRKSGPPGTWPRGPRSTPGAGSSAGRLGRTGRLRPRSAPRRATEGGDHGDDHGDGDGQALHQPGEEAQDRLEAAGEGRGRFSVFGLTDSEGDQLVPGAFKAGQEVPMVWAHQWDRPVGRGVVRVEHGQAVFAGRSSPRPRPASRPT